MDTVLPGAPSFLGTLVESSWQAALLVLVVLAVQRGLGRCLTPAWRHAMWWIVLGRLLLPVTPPSSWSVFHLLPQPSSTAATSAEAGTPASDWKALSAIEGTPTPLPTASLAPNLPTVSEDAPRRNVDAGAVAAIVWGMVAIALLARLAWRNAKFSRRVRGSMRPASATHALLLQECRTSMRVRQRIELLQGDLVSSPAIYGLFRPRLLLPSAFIETGTSAQLRHVFLHELAHVRRGDLVVHGITRILQALHWFNPILAWAFRRVRADRELATDALALQVAGEGESRAYGLTIVQWLERWSEHPTQSGTVGILEDNASLEQRIRAIARFRQPSRWAPLTALLLAALAAVSWTSAQPAAAPDPIPVAEAPATGGMEPPSGTPTAGSAPPASSDPTPSIGEEGRVISRLHSSREVDRLLALLHATRIPEVAFEGVALSEVSRQLKEWSRVHSPDGDRVNFMMAIPATNRTETSASPAETLPIRDITIRIDPPLRDVRLIDLLKAITQSASAPLGFQVESYGVVFQHPAQIRPQLVTRVFRVDIEKMGKEPENLTGLESTPVRTTDWNKGPGSSPVLQEKVQQLLKELGVSLLPPSAIFFNDRMGLLMVRATVGEVETLEGAIEALNNGTRSWSGVAPEADATEAAVSTLTGDEASLLAQHTALTDRLESLLATYTEESLFVQATRERLAQVQRQLGQDPPIASTPSAPGEIRLVLLPDVPWRLNDRAITSEQFTEHLRQVAKVPGGTNRTLRIEVDPRLPWKQAFEAISSAQAAGFHRVSFSQAK